MVELFVIHVVFLYTGQFELVKIMLDSNDVRETVVKVLNACDISTSYIDKIPRIKQDKRGQFR